MTYLQLLLLAVCLPAASLLSNDTKFYMALDNVTLRCELFTKTFVMWDWKHHAGVDVISLNEQLKYDTGKYAVSQRKTSAEDFTYDLTVKRLIGEDDGVYSCSVGGSQVKTEHELFVVEPTTSVTLNLSRNVVLAGATVRAQCRTVDGKPLPHLKWIIKGVWHSGWKTSENYTHTYPAENVTERKGEQYTSTEVKATSNMTDVTVYCLATQTFGSGNKRKRILLHGDASFVVQYPPVCTKLYDAEMPILSQLGKLVTVPVGLRANPENTTLTCSSADAQISHGDDNTWMVSVEISSPDSYGSVNCSAQNSVGSSPCLEFTVHGDEPAEAPTGCVFLNVTTNSAIISCNASYDGGSRSFYILYNVNSKDILKLATHAQPWFSLKRLQPGSQYTFSVCATNVRHLHSERCTEELIITTRSQPGSTTVQTTLIAPETSFAITSPGVTMPTAVRTTQTPAPSMTTADRMTSVPEVTSKTAHTSTFAASPKSSAFATKTLPTTLGEASGSPTAKVSTITSKSLSDAARKTTLLPSKAATTKARLSSTAVSASSPTRTLPTTTRATSVAGYSAVSTTASRATSRTWASHTTDSLPNTSTSNEGQTSSDVPTTRSPVPTAKTESSSPFLSTREQTTQTVDPTSQSPLTTRMASTTTNMLSSVAVTSMHTSTGEVTTASPQATQTATATTGVSKGGPISGTTIGDTRTSPLTTTEPSTVHHTTTEEIKVSEPHHTTASKVSERISTLRSSTAIQASLKSSAWTSTPPVTAQQTTTPGLTSTTDTSSTNPLINTTNDIISAASSIRTATNTSSLAQSTHRTTTIEAPGPQTAAQGGLFSPSGLPYLVAIFLGALLVLLGVVAIVFATVKGRRKKTKTYDCYLTNHTSTDSKTDSSICSLDEVSSDGWKKESQDRPYSTIDLSEKRREDQAAQVKWLPRHQSRTNETFTDSF